MEETKYITINGFDFIITKELDFNNNHYMLAIDEKGETIDKLTYGQDFVNIVAVVNKQKEVTINKNIVGEIDDNYKIDSAELNKSTVLIKGPKEAIDKINSIETQDINIEKLTQSKTVPIKFILPSDISLVSNESDYSINLVVHKKINKKLEIPKNQIEVLNKPQNKNVVINSNTIKINLIGFQDDLDKIKTENIKLIVDLKNKESGTSHIRPSVKLDGINIKPELIQSLDNVSITLTE